LRSGRGARLSRDAWVPREDRQEFENEGIPGEEPVGSSCIYYNRAGGDLGDSFQFCFTKGRLDSKNAY
jgi:hypothetical protein